MLAGESEDVLEDELTGAGVILPSPSDEAKEESSLPAVSSSVATHSLSSVSCDPWAEADEHWT